MNAFEHALLDDVRDRQDERIAKVKRCAAINLNERLLNLYNNLIGKRDERDYVDNFPDQDLNAMYRYILKHHHEVLAL